MVAENRHLALSLFYLQLSSVKHKVKDQTHPSNRSVCFAVAVSRIQCHPVCTYPSLVIGGMDLGPTFGLQTPNENKSIPIELQETPYDTVRWDELDQIVDA